jgi:kynureninase
MVKGRGGKFDKRMARMKETEAGWNPEKDLDLIRKNFPILDKCVYLISNSLGAVPMQTREALERYYTLWAEEGVSAWEKEWWKLSQKVGDRLASLIGAEKDSVAMIPNATVSHWVALSTKFSSENGKRNKVVMTDHDFPSIMYAISKICTFMGWKLDVVPTHGKPGIDIEAILDRVDEETLFVATSHVYFRSAYIQDVARLSKHARNKGVLTVIDGYHAPGTIPVDVNELGVDFYIGGCLKWLCGGPGNAFLYARHQLQEESEPFLTGWLAHKDPFGFYQQMEFTVGAYKFMSGTPPIPSLYTALEGLDIIQKIGAGSIRKKSAEQTTRIIDNAQKRGFLIHTPIEKERRGGAVSVSLPHAQQVKQALVKKNVKVDFRKGKEEEPDVIRIGPHFYTKDSEIDYLFELIDEILSSGEYRKFSDKPETVT